MASRLSESGRNIGSETVDTIKQHPGTAALFGMGLGFLLVSSLWNRSSGKEGEHQETYTGIASGDAEYVMHPEQGMRGSVFLEDDRHVGLKKFPQPLLDAFQLCGTLILSPGAAAPGFLGRCRNLANP